jgi:hypothetical protein
MTSEQPKSTPPGTAQEKDLAVHQALLADASSWAQHYSVVRMTVTTFLLGLSIGILTTKWEELTLLLWLVIGGLWPLALALFVIFTRHEAVEMIRRHNDRIPLLEHIDPQGRAKENRQAGWNEIYPGEPDLATKALIVATIALVALFIIWLMLPSPYVHKMGWF